VNKIPSQQTPPDFSLSLGGPLYQLYRRTFLSGAALELLHRRVVVVSLVAWLPLLILSLIEGHASTGTVKIPFLLDVEAHVRFLIALPALVIAEVVIHRRITPLIQRFVDRKIVVEQDLPKFKAAVQSALRIRNSAITEFALLALVYTFGLWAWRRNHLGAGGATWYAQPDATGLRLTLAGYWYAFVSTPIFQFIILRWYMRIVLWFRFLWQTSRLDLRLTASHPDRAGGLGFLGKSSYAFGPILFAQGALLSGLIATRVLYEGQNLVSFKLEAVGLIGAMVLFVLGPLFIFSPVMERTQRKGIAQFGLLAQRYAAGFEQKWAGNEDPEMSELLGSADIQSLADLGNSYSVVSEMRFVPFTLTDVIRLVVATAAPLVPLALTVISFEELLSRLFQILI
jgi:hypothetical protein